MSNRTPIFGRGPLTECEREWYLYHRCRIFGSAERLPFPLPPAVFQGFAGRRQDARQWLSYASRIRNEGTVRAQVVDEINSGWRPAPVTVEPVLPARRENPQGELPF